MTSARSDRSFWKGRVATEKGGGRVGARILASFCVSPAMFQELFKTALLIVVSPLSLIGFIAVFDALRDGLHRAGQQ